jgi:hypothetical protein
VAIGCLVELVDDSGKGVDSDDNLDVVAGADSIGGIGGADIDLVVAGDTSADVDSSLLVGSSKNLFNSVGSRETFDVVAFVAARCNEMFGNSSWIKNNPFNALRDMMGFVRPTMMWTFSTTDTPLTKMMSLTTPRDIS